MPRTIKTILSSDIAFFLSLFNCITNYAYIVLITVPRTTGMAYDDEFDSPSQNAFWATAVLGLEGENRLSTQQRDIMRKKECCNEALDGIEDEQLSQEVTWNEKRKYHFVENDPDRKGQSLKYSDEESDDRVVKFTSDPVQGVTTPAPHSSNIGRQMKKQRQRRRMSSINVDTNETSTFCESFIAKILVEEVKNKDLLGKKSLPLDIGKYRKWSITLRAILNPSSGEDKGDVLFKQKSNGEVIALKEVQKKHGLLVSKYDIAKKRLQAMKKRNLKLLEARSWNLNNVTKTSTVGQPVVSQSRTKTTYPGWFFDDFE
jgi:hypothetical protein